MLRCCTVIVVHNTHFKVCATEVEVDLCDIASEGVTQMCFARCSREAGTLAWLPAERLL